MTRALGAGADLSYALCGLGYARLQEGNVSAATACFLEATALTWSIRDDAFPRTDVLGNGGGGDEQQQTDTAARIIGAADALDARTGSAMWPNDRALAASCLVRLEDALDAAALAALRRSGASLPVEQAVALSRGVAMAVLGEEHAAAIWRAAGAPEPGQPAAPGLPAVAEPSAARGGLTPRELDVLQQLVDGRTDREIAQTLYISRRTASKHVEAILAKLGVRSRGAAVAEARRFGILAPESPGQERESGAG